MLPDVAGLDLPGELILRSVCQTAALEALHQHLAVHDTVEAALAAPVAQVESSRSSDGASPSESRNSS